VGNGGKWEFVDGIHPTFDRREHWGDDSDDDDVTDLTDVTTDATAETDAAAATKVRTAKGDAEYNADWNGIDSSDDPTLTTLRLLHSARQMVDTSRWWTLRWPNSAISLLGTACGLDTEGTFKLLRRLRKVTVHHVRELWAVVMDRRHAADNVAKRAALKEEWLKLYRVLANMRNRRGKLMPGWITLQQKPIYTIKSQLVQWRKLRRMQVATGGQRGITSYFSRTPHTRAARRVATPDDGPAAAATAATSPAVTTSRLTATATTASQLRGQALERTTEQKSKRRRQHDNDDLDGATSESPTLTEIDSACADHDARCLRRFGRTAEGDHGRTSGSDDGYGRIVEAAAGGGRVLPAHNATQS